MSSAVASVLDTHRASSVVVSVFCITSACRFSAVVRLGKVATSERRGVRFSPQITPPNTWRLRTNDNPEDAAHRTSLGRTILVKHPRYGYTAGRPMKIIGAETDNKNRTMTMELWG